MSVEQREDERGFFCPAKPCGGLTTESKHLGRIIFVFFFVVVPGGMWVLSS